VETSPYNLEKLAMFYNFSLGKEPPLECSYCVAKTCSFHRIYTSKYLNQGPAANRDVDSCTGQGAVIYLGI